MEVHRRRWPGWDGLVLGGLAALAVGVWLLRGRVGGGWHLAAVLALDLAWWWGTWWSRRGAGGA